MDYSFVVPIYRDAAHAPAFAETFERVMRKRLEAAPGARPLSPAELAARVELIFVNDGSPDDAESQLSEVVRRFPFVRTIHLSRNFGQHIALSCGYRNARGRIVGMLNVDREDPPDQIPVVLDALESGAYDIVCGLRTGRRGAWYARAGSVLFNLALNRLTGARTPLNVATLRVMNRPFVDAFNLLTERSRFIPGLEWWLGFRHGYVPITNRPSAKSRSSYRFLSRWRMAFESVISFSDLPLRLGVYAGLSIAAAGVLLSGGLVVSKLFFVDYRPGYTSTIAALVFLSGVQIAMIGLAGLYIGRILSEVQGRPLYLIRSSENLPEPR
jgi:dolichol-phosphate mannosyltransferase